MKKFLTGIFLLIIALPLFLGQVTPEVTMAAEEVNYLLPEWHNIILITIIVLLVIIMAFWKAVLKTIKKENSRNSGNLGKNTVIAISYCTGMVVGFFYLLSYKNLILSGVMGIVTIELMNYLLIDKSFIGSICKYYIKKPIGSWFKN